MKPVIAALNAEYTARVGIARRAAVRGVGMTGVEVVTWFLLVPARNEAQGVMICPESVAQGISKLKGGEEQ